MEPSVGAILKQSREARGLSVDEVARHAKIFSSYVFALEAGRYHAFPAKVYALGHLRRLAFYLGIENMAAVETAFEREWTLRVHPGAYGVSGRATKRMRLAMTPGLVAGVGLGAVVLFFAVFFGVQLVGFVGEPALEIVSPVQGAVVSQPFILIEGKGERESQLTVNGREIILDESGNFREHLELLPGLNILEFYLENRFGRMSGEVRRVVVQ